MSTRYTAPRAIVKGQRRVSRKYEVNVETNSDSNSGFEDVVDSEPPPEGTAQPAAARAPQPTVGRAPTQHTHHTHTCP